MQSFDFHIHKTFQEHFDIQKKESPEEEKLYKKTEKYLRYIKWIPGIKMIGVGNSLSMNCSTKHSDIDLYIVSEKNRMWLVRIFTTFIFQILGVRKTAKKHAGRFCLSFFSTLEGMDFSKFALEDDIYLYFWIIYFKPILDYDDTYSSFLEKNNSWADFSKYKDILEKNRGKIVYKKRTKSSLPLFRKIFIGFLNLLDNFLKKIFLPKTLKTYKKIGKPFGVIINDNMLKFHNGDIREKLKKEIL